MRTRFPAPKWLSVSMRDWRASIVVFLISLPLCMAIALASHMPAESGLISGIVGGLVAAPLGSGCLQVTGPAAGLTVAVANVITSCGVDCLGASVLLAGAFQLICSMGRRAQWFAAIPPAVISGMLAGIGLLVFASQIHLMLGDAPRVSGVENLCTIPHVLLKLAVSDQSSRGAAAVGVITMISLMGSSCVSARWRQVFPAPLVAISIATVFTQLSHLPVQFIEVPSSMIMAVHFFDPLKACENWRLVLTNAVLIAAVASAETLLTAIALDKKHTQQSTDLNRELLGQGIANMICGAVSSLPVTGVIIRSGANLAAGAQSKSSAILVGVWLFFFVTFCAPVLRMIPTASLAALLVVTGIKLIDLQSARQLMKFGKSEIAIYMTTIAVIVLKDLLSGVVAGVILALVKLIYEIVWLDVKVVRNDVAPTEIRLKGAATFLQLPSIIRVLDLFEPGERLCIDTDGLSYIDHACIDLLIARDKRARNSGGALHLDWHHLNHLYKREKRRQRSLELPLAKVGRES